MTASVALDDRVLFNKVPRVTVDFWIIKLLAVTVGETAADYMNLDLGLGLSLTSWILTVFLIAALILQFAQDLRVPAFGEFRRAIVEQGESCFLLLGESAADREEATRQLIKKKIKSDRMYESMRAEVAAELNVIVFMVIANAFQGAAFATIRPAIAAVVPYKMRSQALSVTASFRCCSQ